MSRAKKDTFEDLVAGANQVLKGVFMINKQKYLERIKTHYEATTASKISDADALGIFENLVTLVSAVYRPIQKEFFKDIYCPSCGERISLSDFKDELSQKESLVSSLCQDCQDLTF